MKVNLLMNLKFNFYFNQQLDKSYRDGQMVIQFKPHNNDVAHNHGLKKSPPSLAVPLERIPVHDIRQENGWFAMADDDDRIRLVELTNEDFTIVLPAENKWGNYIRDPVSSRDFYRHKPSNPTGITVYRCLTGYKNRKCKARAFIKTIGGIEYIKTDLERHHKGCPMK